MLTGKVLCSKYAIKLFALGSFCPRKIKLDIIRLFKNNDFFNYPNESKQAVLIDSGVIMI